MKVIGLTGSIGTGKSSVSNLLKKKGISIIDADEISRNLTKNKNIILEIEILFKEKLKNIDGSLDRKKLANIVFNSKSKLEKLNNFLHPKIRLEIQQKIDFYKSSKKEIVFLDAPLLIESNLIEFVDGILLIICDEKIQLDRIRKRDGISEKEVFDRIKNQMSQNEKQKFADFIIDNSFDFKNLEIEVDNFLKKLEFE